MPVFISLIVQVPGVFLVMQDRRFVPTSSTPAELLIDFALAIVGPLALLGARRFPGPVVAIVAAAASLDLFLGAASNGPPYIALAFAIVGAIARGARLWAWISIAVCWVTSLVVAMMLGLTWEPFRIALTTLGILVLMGIGEGMRTRKERYERVSQVIAQRRQSEVQAERVRIARELHDVLAHSLSQINVQAGVGLHLMDAQPDKAKDALASIKETSKTALDEVRSVLGVLRADGGTNPDAPLVPEPDLSRLAGLAASVTSQGVEVALEGSLVDVPQATQLAIYRIVQESLTNVLRHAHARHATVELREENGQYAVTITDDGTAPAPTGTSDGRGLLGMSERAELLGGELSAGPVEGGGFRVDARIPARAREAIS
ncbi:MAG: sensor histidine kinase [Glaciihabitans sp.]|nr:sensor histidine kinase [Glaciihabitans sp.]